MNTMKHFSIFGALAGLALLAMSSCTKVVGHGPVETESRSAANFSGVTSAVSGTVNIHIEPQFTVSVSAQRNILDVLRTRVVGDELRIYFEPGARVRTTEPITISIGMPTADLLGLSGSGDMHVSGAFESDNLELAISGSGSITVQEAVVAHLLEATVSGSGSITLFNGSAAEEELHISGSGGIDLNSVTSENAETHTSGSGNIRISVSDNLDAHISGSGSVYYRGNPVISTHISGSGRVIPF